MEYENDPLPDLAVAVHAADKCYRTDEGLSRQQVGEALDKIRHGALSEQSGGDHYRTMPIQPVEFIIANKIGFLAGNVIKYASRYPSKGGASDIRKIIHYCRLILEFEYGERNG